MSKVTGREETPKHNSKNEMDNLKWETAEELGLDEDLREGGDELTVREAGKIGGNMTKKLVEKGERSMTEEEKI